MTNKLPVVGKRYRYKYATTSPRLTLEYLSPINKDFGEEWFIKAEFGITDLVEEIFEGTIKNFFDTYEELPNEDEKTKNILLARALGLIEGALEIKNMEDFNKEGLIRSLEEIRDILKQNLNLN